MNRLGRGAVLLILGVVVAQLVLDGSFGAFVQQRMRIPLAVAAGTVVVLGLVDLAVALRERSDDELDRPVGPRVGWLLAAPVLVLVAVAPTSLGAAAADRVDSFEPSRPDDLAQLPENDPFAMQVLDFVTTARWDETGALVGRRVILEGLVVNDADLPDGFHLTRFLVSCCAADGIPIKVTVRGVEEPFADDQWVRAIVTLRESSAATDLNREVEVDVVEIVPAEAPASPYESPF
ncbi:MAG: TIGR03943 family protein [Actinomycetota bacterium]